MTERRPDDTAAAPAVGADLLLRRVRLVPLDGMPTPSVETDVLIRTGRITAVGPGLDRSGHGSRGGPGGRSDLRGSDLEVYDGAGRFVIPGLWDHHVHLVQWALTASRLDLSGTSSAWAVLDRVAGHLRTLGPGSELVQGYGYRSAAWPERPSVAQLDTVTGRRPVVLVSGDAHNGWLNSAAFTLLGVPPVEGPLEEDDWFPIYGRLQDLPGAAEAAAAAYRREVRRAHAKGIVGVTDLEFDRGHVQWPRRIAAGIDTLKVRVGAYAEELDDILAARLRTGDPLPGGGGMAVMGPLKIISDGSVNTRTAYCCHPYADTSNDMDRGPDARGGYGRQLTPPDVLSELLTRAHANGLSAAVHAIGDAANRDAVEAFAATGARGTIEHAQLLRREDIPRMAALGVAASVQPAHLLDDRDITERLWAGRCDRAYALRWLLDAGVELRFGSDAPVAPLDPWLAMAAAVHRSADERPPWHGEQALSVAEALRSSVDGIPAVAPGGPGDLVLLDEDPLAGADSLPTGTLAARLRATPVAATVVAGRVVHG